MILVVEDDADVQDFLAYVLRPAGYRVEFANDGLHAIEMLRSQPLPDLVFLDLLLPHADGNAVLQTVLKIENGLRPAVVLLTAFPGEMREELAEAVKGTLPKPTPLDTILAAARKYAKKEAT